MNAALAKDLCLEDESARSHIADALMILEKPDGEIDELDLETVRHRLRRALAAAEKEAWANLEPVGINVRIDEPAREFVVSRQFERVILRTTDWPKASRLVRTMRIADATKTSQRST